jgi:hypothetical protein
VSVTTCAGSAKQVSLLRSRPCSLPVAAQVGRAAVFVIYAPDGSYLASVDTPTFGKGS